MRGWVFRNIFGVTGANGYSKLVIGILRGRESAQVRKRIYARDSYKIVSKAKRFLEPMEFRKFNYNFERISAGKKALNGCIPIRIHYYDDGDVDSNRKLSRDSKEIMDESLGLVFIDDLRVKRDFIREKMPSVINLKRKIARHANVRKSLRDFPNSRH